MGTATRPTARGAKTRPPRHQLPDAGEGETSTGESGSDGAVKAGGGARAGVGSKPAADDGAKEGSDRKEQTPAPTRARPGRQGRVRSEQKEDEEARPPGAMETVMARSSKGPRRARR